MVLPTWALITVVLVVAFIFTALIDSAHECPYCGSVMRIEHGNEDIFWCEDCTDGRKRGAPTDAQAVAE